MVPHAANVEMRSCGKLPVLKNDGKFIKESFKGGYVPGLNFKAEVILHI